MPERLQPIGPAAGQKLIAAEGKHLFTWRDVTRAVEYTVTFTVASAGAMEFVETTKTNRLSTELPGNGECTWRVAPRFPDDGVWPGSGTGWFML